MADPLSIAASVAGLLTTAGKIYSVLSDFVGAAADAPQSARAALNAVEEVRSALEMVQGLIDTISSLPSRRKMLVRLDHIRVTFTNCVLTLSELESLVCSKDGAMHRLRWAWGEKKVLRLLPRLESQKASLSLMVTVLLCESEMKALESRERLNVAVGQILQRDQEFAARLQSLDAVSTVDDRSVRFYDRESILASRKPSTLTAAQPGTAPGSGLLAGPALSAQLEALWSGPQASVSSRREFETILKESRVYSRTQSNESDMSLASSAVRSHAWSLLSLNDISIASVFHLPITLDDINAFGPGLTFASLLNEQAHQLPPSMVNFKEVSAEGTGILVGSSHRQVSYTVNMFDNARQIDLRYYLDPAPKEPSASSVTSNVSRLPTRNRSVRRRKRSIQELKIRRLIPEPGPLAGAAAARGPAQSADGKPVAGVIKLVVVGDASTEKTAALVSYTTNEYPREYVPAVFDNYTVTFGVRDERYRVVLLDTAGTEDYWRLRPLDYPQTNVFLVFTRIGIHSTYQHAEELWIPEIIHHCPGVPFMVVGIGSHDDDELLERDRKSYLPSHRRICAATGEAYVPGERSTYTCMGEDLAARLGAVCYAECNIFTRDGVNHVFDEAMLAAVEPLLLSRRSGRLRVRPPSFLRTLRESKGEE